MQKKKLYREYTIAGIYKDDTVAVLPLGPWIYILEVEAKNYESEI